MLIFMLLTIASAAFASSFSILQTDNMQGKIATFVDELHLPSSHSQELIGTLEGNSNLSAFLTSSDYVESGLVSLACSVAKTLIGAESVSTTPVNQTEVEGNWSETCWNTPTCVIIPHSTHDVSITLKIVKFFQVKFSVRSGGHSPNPGFSSIGKSGLLIDLQKLNQITVSTDKKVASLGPGGRWGEVYAALAPYDVTVIGGRLPLVGVGGLILGGGYSHFSARYGLAADNVKNFEIVLADGTITDANAEKNTDLFWALKGGGPNFGIVTRFDLYTVPVKDIWYSASLYSTDKVPTILKAFVEWQENGASDPKGTIGLIIGLEYTTILYIYSEPSENPPAAFDPFYNISAIAWPVPPTNGTVLSLSQLSATSNPVQRHDYRAASSKIDLQLYQDVYEHWREQAVAVNSATGANQTFVIQPITTNIIEQGNLKGGNPLGLPNENFQCWTTLIDWNDTKDDPTVREVSIATTEKWKQLSQERGLSVPFEYMNDASRDQNPLASYGSENLSKLKIVSQNYDPTQVFQKLQNDGFLLSKV